MSLVQYSINMAARKSGLTAHVIRVWERRYGAVTPIRTGTNRRLYSDKDVERLALLGQAVAAGHRIGNIATLPEAELRYLLATAPTLIAGEPQGGGQKGGEEDYVLRCLEAVRRMDARGFSEVLNRALVARGHQGLLRKVVAPLVRDVGNLWQEGVLTAAHEHFASAFIRDFLGNGSRQFALDASAPCLVVATPTGQLHELGAVMVATAARNLGWRVVYLGVSLPAAEIAGAVLQNQARAVALSLVYPSDDPALGQELMDLRGFLPPGVGLLVGGRASGNYQEALAQAGAIHTECLDSLGRELDKLRLPGTAEVSAKP